MITKSKISSKDIADNFLKAEISPDLTVKIFLGRNDNERSLVYALLQRSGILKKKINGYEETRIVSGGGDILCEKTVFIVTGMNYKYEGDSLIISTKSGKKSIIKDLEKMAAYVTSKHIISFGKITERVCGSHLQINLNNAPSFIKKTVMEVIRDESVNKTLHGLESKFPCYPKLRSIIDDTIHIEFPGITQSHLSLQIENIFLTNNQPDECRLNMENAEDMQEKKIKDIQYNNIERIERTQSL